MSRVIPAFAQFFGSDGEPLANGWLRFLISGTNNTAKNTYADANQTIPNPNPLRLDGEGRAPNIFGQGIYRVILYQNNIVLHQPGTMLQMFDPIVADYLPEGAGGNFAEWDAEVIYQIGQIVLFNEFYYRAVTANNLGNQPDLHTEDWERIEFLRFWNLDVTYKENDVVIYGSALFTSIQDANLNHNPAVNPLWWSTVGPNTLFDDMFVITEEKWRSSDAAGLNVTLLANITLTSNFAPTQFFSTNGFTIDGAFTLDLSAVPTPNLTDNCFDSSLTVIGLSGQISPKWWGVVADSQTISDAVAAIGDNTLTSASNPWIVADVGKLILVEGAGASGDTLITTIAAYNGPGSIELTDAPTSDPTGTDNGAQWGTDNTTAIQSAIDSTIIGNMIIDRGILYNYKSITGIGGATVSITDYSRTGDWDEGLQIQNHLGVIGDIDLSPVGSGNPELTFKMRRGGYGKLYDQAIISTNPTTQQFMIKFPNAAGTMVDIINFLTNTNTPNWTFKYPIYLDRGPTANCSINFNSSGAGNSYIEWNHSNNEMRYYVRNSGDTAWVLVHRDSNSRKTIDLETHLNRSSGNIALYFDENGTSRAFIEYNTSNNEMRFYIRNAADSAWIEAFGVSGENDNPAMIWPKVSAVPAAAPANSIKTYSRDAGPGVRMMAQNSSGTELTLHLCVSNETQMRAADSAGISIILGANITLTSNFTPTVPINTNGYQIDGAYTLSFATKQPSLLINNCFGSSVTVSGLYEIKPEWFGAIGDGATDDKDAIQRSIDSLPSSGGKISLSGNVYALATGLSVSKSSIFIIGRTPSDENYNSNNGTELKYTGTTDATAKIIYCTAAAHSFSVENLFLNANEKAGYCLYQFGDNTPALTRGGSFKGITFGNYLSKGWVIGDHTDTLNAAQFQMINAHDIKFVGGATGANADGLHVNAQNLEILNIFGIYIDPPSSPAKYHRNHIRQIAGGININGMLSTRAGTSTLIAAYAIYSQDQLILKSWRSEDRFLIDTGSLNIRAPFSIDGVVQRDISSTVGTSGSDYVIRINQLNSATGISNCHIQGSIYIGATNAIRLTALDIFFDTLNAAGTKGAIAYGGPQNQRELTHDVDLGTLKIRGSAPGYEVVKTDGTSIFKIDQGSIITPRFIPSTLSSNQTAWALGSGYFFRAGATTDISIFGIGETVSGRTFKIINVSSFNLTFVHESASAGSTANRIKTTDGTNIVLTQNQIVECFWDSAENRWRVWKIAP